MSVINNSRLERGRLRLVPLEQLPVRRSRTDGWWLLAALVFVVAGVTTAIALGIDLVTR